MERIASRILNHRTDTLAQLDKLTAAYEQLPGVASAHSLTNAPDVQDTGWGVEVGTLVDVDALSANAENDRVRRRVMQNQMYRGTLFDGEGTSTALILMLDPHADHLTLAREITDVTARVTARVTDDDPRYYFGGMPFTMFSIIRTFGYTVSLGIFVAMVVTPAFLPALATIFDPTPRPRGVRSSGTTRGRAALRWLADVVFYRREPI